MPTTETFSIIIVEPIMSEEEFRAAQRALEMLGDAEPGSPDHSKRSRIAEMIRSYEERGRDAVRHAGEASAEWTAEHRSGLGWIAGGVVSIAAALGIARWRRSQRPKTLRGRVGAFAEKSTQRIAGVGKAGVREAKSRAKSLR